MALLFILKQNMPELALAEAKAAVHGWGFWRTRERIEDGTAFFPGARKVPEHLALTRRIVRVHASCSARSLARTLAAMQWQRILRKRPYRITLTRCAPCSASERELAHIIWKAQAAPNVDLQHPQITIDIVTTRKRAYVGVRAWEEHERFEDRRAHLWPAPHPSAVHPTTARALANIACSGRIDDPFCGAGGILIEAGIARMRTTGGDIDNDMLARARRNLEKFGVRATLRHADATVDLPRTQAIVTDLPYGKSTRGDSGKLIRAFLSRARTATRRVVVGLPAPLSRRGGWAVRAHVSLYVHKNMTRHFYVLERAA
jgi:tRNA (guanine10-N2)-dimethyltransferase